MDGAGAARRLPDDRLRARRADPREPVDRRAQAAGQQAADQARRPARLHPLPARHRVSDPRSRARPGRRSRGVDRAGPTAAGWRWSWSSSSTRCSACATAARRLPRREYPSAYGQMGRCLSPCLGDLDPNLYRRRLDQALRLFAGGQRGAGSRPGQALLDHVDDEMRRASAERRYERAQALHRRAGRLRAILGRLDGVLEATHARPLLVLARHPSTAALEGFWLAGGRLVDSGVIADGEDLVARVAIAAARARAGARGSSGRTSRPGRSRRSGSCRRGWRRIRTTPTLTLEPMPDRRRSPARRRGPRGRGVVSRTGARRRRGTRSSPTSTSDPGGASRRTSASPICPNRGDAATLDEPSDHAVAEHELGSDRRGIAQPQAAQLAVGLAAVEQPRDRLLADVAALLKRDGAVVEAGLLRDHAVIEVDPVPGAAALDPDALGGRVARCARRPRRAERARQLVGADRTAQIRSIPASVRTARTSIPSSVAARCACSAAGGAATPRIRSLSGPSSETRPRSSVRLCS